VDEYFASLKSGLSIVGYYHANECFDDYELSSIARKVGDHIARYCPQAGILLVKNALPSLIIQNHAKVGYLW
jgi:hypothetical protein